MKRTLPVPELLVIAWVVVAGVGLALAASTATEPPSYDPMSYVLKAFKFWDAVASGHFLYPWNIEPTVRPPGTILVSYPFGFSPDFRWFYFRTCFIPLVSLVAAVYIAGYARLQTAAERWVLAATALTLGGMPSLYQFQTTDLLPASLFWGLVDNFMAGVAAVAMASVVRGVWRRSLGWTLAGALAAALCLMIKPSGLLVMGLVGMTWLILLGVEAGWSLVRLRQDGPLYAYAVKGLKAALLTYVLALIAAFFSKYFSPQNIAYGSQVMSVMGGTILSSFDMTMLRFMTRIGFGYPVAAVIAVGFGAAMAVRGGRGEALAALLCLVLGGWFWIVETDVVLVRYFFPFATMTFVALVPVWSKWVAVAPSGYRRSAILLGAAVAATPTLIITVLMLQPNPSLRWQAALGINLVSNYYPAEGEQASALLAKMKREGERAAQIYMFHTTSPLRSFAAGLEYPALIDSTAPQLALKLPMDWQRSTTFRVKEMLASRYIAFEPIPDEGVRKSVLERHAKDFNDESVMMNAVFTDLGEADGLCTLSETRVRLLEVCRPAEFEAAMARVSAAYAWTADFHDANAN